MTQDKNTQMLLDAGQIVGTLLKHTTAEWFDLCSMIETNREFRYNDQIYRLAELRSKILSGNDAGINQHKPNDQDKNTDQEHHASDGGEDAQRG